MKSFLLNKDNKPIIKWGQLKDNIFYEGQVPEEFSLAVAPFGKYIVLDVDVKGDKDGFKYIPTDVLLELEMTFWYNTKSGGAHFWCLYTGNKTLMNRATKFGLDCRVGADKRSNGGYVKYNHSVDIRECIHLIKPTTSLLNEFLEKLFS